MPIKKPQKAKRPPPGFKHHIAALKLKMISATDFSEILSYFFDHLGEDKGFLNLGRGQNNTYLKQILLLAARKALNIEEIKTSELQMIHLAEFKFIHGGGFFNQYLGTYFYFEDIDAGLLALAHFPPTGRTEIVRFSCQVLDSKPKPFVN